MLKHLAVIQVHCHSGFVTVFLASCPVEVDIIFHFVLLAEPEDFWILFVVLFEI